ncbi:MAG: Sapep family Mn(2+)-dependent dipeptidase [Clostridia bacterium]|nr:Sapep family Mn(2+)-dependent dipeptidase [Clostridia bacterium]
MFDSGDILSRAREWLNDHKDEMVSDLRDFVSVRSVSRADLAQEGAPFGTECRKMLDYALSRGAEYGFDVQNADGYYGKIMLGDDDNSIGMIAHLDVVPEGVNWIHPPYGGVVEGDFMFGRGASDNKGSAIACLYVMRMIREMNLPVKHGLRLILGCSEETGMQDMEAYNAREKDCVVTLVPDAAFPVCYAQKGSLTAHAKIQLGEDIVSFDGGEVDNMVPPVAKCVLNKEYECVKAALSVKGLLSEKIEVADEKGKALVTAHGVASHAASPENGVSAIHMLADAILKAGLVKGQSEKALSAISFISQGFYGEHAGISCEDEDTGKTTMVIGIARTHEGIAEVHADCRLSIKADLSENKKAMTEAMENAGFAVTLMETTDPVYIPKDHPMVLALMNAYREITGDETPAYTMGGGTYSRCLKNAITFGLGMRAFSARPENLPAGHGGAHAPDEYQSITALFESTLVFLSSVLKLDEIV